MDKKILWLGLVFGMLLQTSAVVFCADENGIPAEAKNFLAAIEALSGDIELIAKCTQDFGEQGKVDSTCVVRRQGDEGLLSILAEADRLNSASRKYRNEFELHARGSILGAQANLDSQDLPQFSDSEALLSLWDVEVAGTQELDRENMYTKLGERAAVVWWIGRTPVSQYMLTASEVSVEAIANDWFRLRATSKYGLLIAEVSSKTGWLPRRLIVRKKPVDLCVVGTTEDWLAPPPVVEANAIVPLGDTRSALPSGFELVTFEWNITGHTQADAETWYADKFDAKRTVAYSDGTSELLTTNIAIESIDFSPNFRAEELRISLPFPKGSAVSIRGADHLPYQWDGERAVPGIATANFARHSAPTQNSTVKRWLIVTNVLLILAVVVLFSLNRAAAKKRKN